MSNHSKEFTVVSGSPGAQMYSLNIAKALAMTALDVYTSTDLLQQVREDYQQDIAVK